MKSISERAKTIVPISQKPHHACAISNKPEYIEPITEFLSIIPPLRDTCPDNFRGWFQMMGSLISRNINVGWYKLLGTDRFAITADNLCYGIEEMARYTEEINEEDDEEYYDGGDDDYE